MVAAVKYALLNGSNQCVNVVLWDGDTSKWDPAPLTAVPYNPAVHVIVEAPEVGVQRTIDDYIVQRRARLTAIRTQAQAVSAKAAIASGLTTVNLNTAVIGLQTDLKTLAAAIDDLAQYDIRAGRAILGQYDATDN